MSNSNGPRPEIKLDFANPPPAESPNQEPDRVETDLEQLRDILFGQHTRQIEQRLAALENQVVALDREAGELRAVAGELAKKIDRLADGAAGDLAEARKEWQTRLQQQAADYAVQLMALQRSLSETADGHSAQLEAVRHELSEAIRAQQRMSTEAEQAETKIVDHLTRLEVERIAKLEKDTAAQTTAVFRKLENAQSKLASHLQALQIENQRRHDGLAEELRALVHSLDEKKASRQDLGHMLSDLASRLQNAADDAA